MANLNKNNIIRLLSNTRDTEPASSSLTGTVTMTAGNKTVVGVGTAFTTEVPGGSWLYYSADNEIRRVASVFSDTILTLTDGFTNAYAGATFRRIPKKDCDRKEISWLVISGATALVDGVQVPINVGNTETTTGRERESARDFVDPVAFDCQTVNGSILVTVKKG